MRSRIFAIIILILLVALPVFAYLYFTTQRIAKLTISTASGATFSVQLIGSFGVDGLPLADKILSYEKNCTEICTISPILPARYTLMLSSSGKITLSDVVVVNSGDAISRSYIFNDDVEFTPVGNISRDETLPISLVENAISQGWGEFSIIGTDIKSRIWVIKKGEIFSQIGLLSTDQFIPIRTIPSQILSARIDLSRSVLIIELLGNKSLLMDVDLTNEKEIQTIPNIVSVVPGDIWKIQTETGTIELRGDRRVEDIRFTNSIDISLDIRIGYIDKKDTKKLSIANLPLTESVLIRLDRTTGEGIVLRRGLEVAVLFFYNKKPAYIDTSGNIFLIGEDSAK